MNAADQALDQALSAVMDGRATPAEWALVNAAWASDPGLRERWALWHAAGDGLRSTELLTLHREPQALLDALHARLPAQPAQSGAAARRRDWLPPLAVAASFVALALGVGMLRPFHAPEPLLAAAPVAAPRLQGLQGLEGTSFAQAASGRTLTAWSETREAGLPVRLAPEAIDWGVPAPTAPASGARP